MKISKTLNLVAIALLVVSLVPAFSLAASRDKVTELKNEIKQYKRLETNIYRHANKLSSADKLRLKSSVPSGLQDSDSDGVPDVIESEVDGTDQCNGGDHSGDVEIEAEGSVTAATPPNFSVGGKDFVLSDSVVYRNGDASALIIGACVEVKGATIANSSGFTALRVSFKNADDCQH